MSKEFTREEERRDKRGIGLGKQGEGAQRIESGGKINVKRGGKVYSFAGKGKKEKLRREKKGMNKSGNQWVRRK